MNSPNYIKEYTPIDLKLGIKSSLPNVKSTLSLVILLGLLEKDITDIKYSISVGDNIEIANELFDRLYKSIDENIFIRTNISKNNFKNIINGNQLFKSQLESLIVALELIWKLAKIQFVDEKPCSIERTGNKRYPKKLSFTSNFDFINILISENENEYKNVLLHWLNIDIEFDEERERNLLSMLLLFSENAIFKLVDNGNDIIFNNCSIYEPLLSGINGVNINGDAEPKGSLRILKSALKEAMNPYIEIKNNNVVLNEDNKRKLEAYSSRVHNLFSLNSTIPESKNIKKITTVNKNPELMQPRNRIIFGAPGTGKSYKLETDRKEFFTAEQCERVTFHPNYSYSQFVGSYKPVSDREEIAYKFVPGPFLRTYVKAKKTINKNTAFYVAPCNLSNWNFFDKINHIGQEEDWINPPANIKPGDFVYILIGKTGIDKIRDIHKPGVYGLAKVISEPFVDEDDEWVKLKFEIISLEEPLISDVVFKSNNPTNVIQNFQLKPDGYDQLKNIENYNFEAKPQLLIVEEINRANVAAVFGDVFQLLDRDKNGESEYPINASEDVRKYLAEQGIESDTLSLPSNMYIWATMNSADQGVFPMDTAFKRRWNFEYIGINDAEKTVTEKYIIPINENQNVDWNDLRKAINNKLIDMKVNEDKLLGFFFLGKSTLENALKDRANFINLFKNKVIMYLFEDVVKMKRNDFFNLENNRYIFSEICDEFDKNGIKVFNIDLDSVEVFEISNEKTTENDEQLV